jgi:hypothetical protein
MLLACSSFHSGIVNAAEEKSLYDRWEPEPDFSVIQPEAELLY